MSSGILNTASVQLPTLLLAAYFTPVVVGWYSLAYTVLKLPMTFVGSAIGQVFFQHSSELKEKEGELARISFNLYKRLLWLGVVPMALVGAFGDVIFEFVLGEEWGMAGMYARILSPWLLIVFAASPITHLLNVLEKQQVNFRFNIFMLVFRAVAIVVGGAFLQDSLLTIVLFGTISFVLWCFFALRILKMAGVGYGKSVAFTATLFVVVSVLTALLIWLTHLVRS
jgi:O-antigen/teichoic acid export membrane protein